MGTSWHGDCYSLRVKLTNSTIHSFSTSIKTTETFNGLLLQLDACLNAKYLFRRRQNHNSAQLVHARRPIHIRQAQDQFVHNYSHDCRDFNAGC